MNIIHEPPVLDIVKICSNAIKGLAEGEIDPAFFRINDYDLDVPEIRELYYNTKHLIEQYSAGKNFITELAKGNVETEAPAKNNFVAPYKELHSTLRHFIWLLKQVAEGNYNVKIDFSGKFSDIFTYLTTSLLDKQELEKKLHENEKILRMIIDTAPDGFSISTIDGKMVYASPSICRMFGYDSFDEVKDKQMLDFIHESQYEKAKRATEELIKNKRTSGAKEYLEKRKDGSLFSVEVAGGLISDENGNPKYLFFAHRDISERLQLKLELQKYAEQLEASNKAKDKFFSIIAHDLRGPFQAFIGFSELLKQGPEVLSPQEIKQFSNDLHQALKNQYQLLTDLLEWSKLQMGRGSVEIESVNLTDEVSELAATMAILTKKKEITLQNNILENLTVKADKKMLRLVLRNLISNSIKFTNNNGVIALAAIAKEGFVELSVADNGIGIEPDDMDKLFRIDIPHTTKGTANEPGTGLGLVLCKEMVEKQGGNMFVESERGKGSRFYFTLPRC